MFESERVDYQQRPAKPAPISLEAKLRGLLASFEGPIFVTLLLDHDTSPVVVEARKARQEDDDEDGPEQYRGQGAKLLGRREPRLSESFIHDYWEYIG